MDVENNIYEDIYREDEGECRVYCDICDKLCIERFHKTHFKSLTHTINIGKKRTIKYLIPKILIYKNTSYYCSVCDKTIKF